MNIAARTLLLTLLAPFSMAPLHAAEAPTGEQTLVVRCDQPVLVSQRAVGELAGQQNQGQVYATRERLMGEIRRACQRAGTTQVLVKQSNKREQRRVAMQAPAR